MPKRIDRSTFLKGAIGCAAAVVSAEISYRWLRQPEPIPGQLRGPSVALGHRLRDGELADIPVESEPLRSTVVIVGGGIAGLSAAWWLDKQGCSDYVLLELEDEVGGNSCSGANSISKYPWGAHYVPLANSESRYVHMLFEELRIIQGHNSSGLPVYNELYLCHEPQERLFKDGAFQEGMVPRRGLQGEDKKQIARFFEIIKSFRQATGADGKPAFAIPLDLSSGDEQWIQLDNLSFSQWLQDNKFDAKPLFWYLNYCCRDDYGSTIERVSAWAGLHYFAGRRGVAANAELNSVVTWPEGNGFLVEKLKEQANGRVIASAAVTKIETVDGGAVITYFDSKTNRQHVVNSKYVIFATPRFLAPHIIAGYSAEAAHHPCYAPWMVANIIIKHIPASGTVSLCWDNVSYTSKSLGYVVANHQDITTREGEKVVTYYYPLSDEDPVAARRRLLSMSGHKWSEFIVEDLTSMHPGIDSEILSIEFCPWGHGMVSPTVGFIWGQGRSSMKKNYGNIFFANSDMSGMSNFEEAQYQGITAASNVLEQLTTT